MPSPGYGEVRLTLAGQQLKYSARSDVPLMDGSEARRVEQLATVHTVEKGESASYSARWTALRRSVVGLLPLGYGDGVRRGDQVLANGYLKYGHTVRRASPWSVGGDHGRTPNSADMMTHTLRVRLDGRSTEVRGDDGGPPYVVKWSDGHEGLVYPGADAHVVPAQR